MGPCKLNKSSPISRSFVRHFVSSGFQRETRHAYESAPLRIRCLRALGVNMENFTVRSFVADLDVPEFCGHDIMSVPTLFRETSADIVCSEKCSSTVVSPFHLVNLSRPALDIALNGITTSEITKISQVSCPFQNASTRERYVGSTIQLDSFRPSRCNGRRRHPRPRLRCEMCQKDGD